MATDGVWDYMSPQEVVDVVYWFLQGYGRYCSSHSLSPHRLTSFTDTDTAFPAPAVMKPYVSLFEEAYAYLHSASSNSKPGEVAYIESLVSNIIVEVTLMKVAAGLKAPVQALKSVPLGARRSYHDDTTVVVMFV